MAVLRVVFIYPWDLIRRSTKPYPDQAVGALAAVWLETVLELFRLDLVAANPTYFFIWRPTCMGRTQA